MSELGGGRASNGGARTGGPMPVPSGMRTPRDIMRDRHAREARRQQEELEQKRLAEERRKSAERRAAAAVPGAVPRFSTTSSQYSPDVAALQGGFDGASEQRRSRGPGEVAGTNVLGEPVGRTSNEIPMSRTRGSSVSQDQPRPAVTNTGASRRSASQSIPRTAATTAAPPPTAYATTTAPRDPNSQFPHAFERWETLSSHWEGLTSYWLHKLEQNTEEIKTIVPNAATLSRQITDLSAAGANLFHAVVELQRLRASSERKFQRWFFNTREEQEKLLEQKAELERGLKAERSTRDEATRQQAEAAAAVENARREVLEMRRELVIAKDEARRAWEELGRRNQESLDTAQSLKEGRVTIVSGVQVMPYPGGARTGSSAPRPASRDGPRHGSAGPGSNAGGGRVQSPEDDREYYRDAASPTNTDPFTDNGRAASQPLHHEPGKPSLTASGHAAQYQSYQADTPASAQTAVQGASPEYSTQHPHAAATTAVATPMTITTAEAQRFYQHPGPSAHIHSSPAQQQQIVGTAGGYAPHHAATTRADVADPESSLTLSDEEEDDALHATTEYVLDANGNVQHDEQGRPVVFTTRRRRRNQRRREGDEDDHGHELAARYAEQMVLPEAPSVPATSAQAMATYPPTSSSAGGRGGTTASASEPDYEGGGYGDFGEEDEGQHLAGLATTHHFPTRLSDVLEEEEERSSRRTAD